VPTAEVLRTYGADYKLILVGDASMSPYEITHAGGSVEHWNDEAGHVWLQRLTAQYRHAAWINPLEPSRWTYTRSVGLLQQLMEGRMYPLTLAGIEEMTRELAR
jgi:uncharacterized protein with von Willebrand factor type A (vWA) domain